MTKNNRETFIQYWPVKFFTGENKEYKQASYEDKHYLNVSGIFGTGYIAMTIENLYIVCTGRTYKKTIHYTI